ncbi:MAG: hypothetical protein OQK12_06165, partial [Motiliproteus sp.]|nr:hypothetical protein [Motiliproteus sp.]
MTAAKDWPRWIQARSRTLLILISLATANLTHASETLVILNWQDYFDPQLIKQFESTQQVQIRQVSFNSNEQRSERLLETEGRGYDLILVSGIDLKAYTKRGWLRRLSLKQLTHVSLSS